MPHAVPDNFAFCILHFALFNYSFNQNLKPQYNKHRTAYEFSFGLILGAENVTNLNTDGGKSAGDNADKHECNVNKPIGVEVCEGEAYANCEGINACGNSHRKHCLEAK